MSRKHGNKRLIFFTPRVHDNLRGWFQAWTSSGIDVIFWTIQGFDPGKGFCEARELQPGIMSHFFSSWNLPGRKEARRDRARKLFFPRVWRLARLLQDERADYLVVRDPQFGSLAVALISRVVSPQTRVALYSQQPAIREARIFSLDFLKIAARIFLTTVLRVLGVSEFTTIPGPRRGSPSSTRKDSLAINRKVQYLPFVIDPPARDSRPAQRGQPVRLLAIGKFDPYKCQEDLIRALSTLPLELQTSFTVSFVGQALQERQVAYLADLQAAARRFGVSRQVTFRTNASWTDTQNLYASHDAVVILSHREPASISLLEGTAHGLLPISSAGNGTVHYLGQALSGLVFPAGDINALSEVLSDIAIRRGHYAALARIAQEEIRGACDPERFSRAWADLFIKENGLSV